MANGNNKRDIDFWKRQVDKFRQSGLSQSEYCRKQGFKFSTFSYWKKKIGKEKISGFIEIENVDLKQESRDNALRLIFNKEGLSFELNISLNFLEKVFH